MYAIPIYPARMRMRNNMCDHGLGPTRVKRISKRAKAEFKECLVMFDHAEDTSQGEKMADMAGEHSQENGVPKLVLSASRAQ